MKIGYKWLILGLLFVTFFLELGTRQIYSAVLPQLKADFAAQGVTDVGSRRPSIRLDVSALGFLACVLPVLWVARSSSLVECCAALTTLGFALGIYEAAHYPAMFDC